MYFQIHTFEPRLTAVKIQIRLHALKYPVRLISLPLIALQKRLRGEKNSALLELELL